MRTLTLLLVASAVGSTVPSSNSFAPVIAIRNAQKIVRRLEQFCGQCIWAGTIVCEARAQYLVNQYGDLTLEEAREEIFEDCSSDDGEPEEATAPGATAMSLDAYCGECPWENMNFNCDSRVSYIEQNYHLSNEKAKESLLEQGQCIDPNYVAPIDTGLNITYPNATTESSSSSIWMIVAIVLIIILLFVIIIIAIQHRQKKILQEELRNLREELQAVEEDLENPAPIVEKAEPVMPPPMSKETDWDSSSAPNVEEEDPPVPVAAAIPVTEPVEYTKEVDVETKPDPPDLDSNEVTPVDPEEGFPQEESNAMDDESPEANNADISREIEEESENAAPSGSAHGDGGNGHQN
mmetsp:Transcript_369/g.774  ORF Transcript_369/g.774 Transcript_369/m.774 type:complete len:351 (-) Transcript_369:103-1155(-)|eukprot:CAMPEP_0201869950 /NCGR_PEP_ID=MMETSP0902-20130614/3265_1 /ASSEMBLY_ACC=CAM_ASM_000551 /TAXON_ID=420261 /ORGANISM="Thalassiosira antarctica, Strain CCMP982" /LENGTH=350 /DNA_ID=CAMNT_0048395519 /DNA_START=132 /DNA_END=1184 /DNA_ORIENTATION=-